MKKFIIGFLIGSILATILCIAFDFNINELLDINIKKVTTSANSEIEVLDAVNSFLRQENAKMDILSSNLKERLLNGEFDILQKDNIQVNDAKIYKILFESNKLNIYVVDVIIEKINGFQWIQLTIHWDPAEKKLYDLVYLPIDYLGRLNNIQINSAQAKETVEHILYNLNKPNLELMGWRYKTTSSGQKGIKILQILDIKPIGSYIPQGKKEPVETAYRAKYIVKGFGKENEIESIMYLKNYSGHWQLEDIKILDIKETVSSS